MHIDNNYIKIEKNLQYILKNFQSNPSLENLSEQAQMSKFHYLRIFKKYTGITPKQFMNIVIFNESQKILKHTSILKASYLLWLESSSKLHNLYTSITWVSPDEWRKNGKWVEILYGFWNTIFWEALIWITNGKVCYLWFVWENKEDVKNDFLKTWSGAIWKYDEAEAQKYLDKIFIYKEKFPLLVKWTNFQIKVWEALLNIPEGNLTTYTEISHLTQNPRWVRAVASAIWSNHIWYLIPCHRVISKMWLLSGYKWGLERKEMLILVENAEKYKRSIT